MIIEPFLSTSGLGSVRYKTSNTALMAMNQLVIAVCRSFAVLHPLNSKLDEWELIKLKVRVLAAIENLVNPQDHHFKARINRLAA